MKADELTSAHATTRDWLPVMELAVREVFEIMLATKLEGNHQAELPSFECTAMVGLAGELCGLLTLRCGTKAATLMASKMLGTEVKEADQHVWDAVGEIANMIAGNFKNKLSGMGDKCMLSVPTVITGSDYNCRSMTDSRSLELVLIFDQQPITVAVEFHS